MNRVGLVAALIAFTGLLTACGSDEEYCAKLPDYFRAMGEGMQADTKDERRWDKWAAEAEATAAVAPSELEEHWDFLADYASRMSEAGGDLNAIKPDDVKKNGTAGNAVMLDARERCNLPPQ
jgi:hypothetical protein